MIEITEQLEQELEPLARAIRLAEGFKLIFVRCNERWLQRKLAKELKLRLPDLSICETEISNPIPHLLSLLREERLEDPHPDAVFVFGLEHSLSDMEQPELSPLIANLNASRDSFPIVVQCPLVIWLSDFALQAIMRGAPDFFAVRSGLHYFEESIRPPEQPTPEEPEDPWTNSSVQEKTAQVQRLNRLISDFEELPTERRDFRAEVRLHIRIGNVLRSLFEFAPAKQHYNTAIDLARTSSYRSGLRDALKHLGILYRHKLDYGQAVAAHEEALRLSQEIGDKADAGNELGLIGNAYLAEGEHGKALESYKKALEMFRQISDRRGEMDTLLNIGLVYYHQDQFQDAENYFKVVLAAAQANKDCRLEAKALIDVANCAAHMQRLDKALELAHKALTVAESVRERPGQQVALHVLGELCYRAGNFVRAVEYSQKAVDTARELGDKAGEHEALVNLGAGFIAIGDHRRGIELSEQAVNLARQIGNRAGDGVARWNMSLGLYQLGHYGEAIEAAEEALREMEQAGFPEASRRVVSDFIRSGRPVRETQFPA